MYHTLGQFSVLILICLLDQKQLGGKTITLKVRYDDFSTISRSRSIASGFFRFKEIWQQIILLTRATDIGTRKVRLVGVTVSNLIQESEQSIARQRQLSLPFFTSLNEVPPYSTKHDPSHDPDLF